MPQTDMTIEPQLRSRSKQAAAVPGCPFPIGVVYYRAPVPPTTYWDQDLARIRAAGLRIVDFDLVDQADIDAGRSILCTRYGEFRIQQPCQYAILDPGRTTKPIARLDGQTVAIESADRRFTWYAVPLSMACSSPVAGQPKTESTLAGVGHPELILPVFASLGIVSPFQIEGDRVVAFRRISAQGNSLVFVLNLERRKAHTRVIPRWEILSAKDLFEGELPLNDGAFEIKADFGEVRIIHCIDGGKQCRD